jgi:pyruvate/2-oxoglutarate dehydrogenase complex dihydrolipoamide acyltransferase (E2) component
MKRKANELREHRRHRKAEKLNATEAATRVADELDVDLHEVKGTGAEGRITISDVRAARGQGE